jgi:hypothetical protein
MAHSENNCIKNQRMRHGIPVRASDATAQAQREMYSSVNGSVEMARRAVDEPLTAATATGRPRLLCAIPSVPANASTRSILTATSTSESSTYRTMMLTSCAHTAMKRTLDSFMRHRVMPCVCVGVSGHTSGPKDLPLVMMCVVAAAMARRTECTCVTSHALPSTDRRRAMRPLCATNMLAVRTSDCATGQKRQRVHLTT